MQADMESALYVPVKLYTQGSAFVTQGLIPRFNEPPEVLTWGERIFVRSPWRIDETDEFVGYREAWAHPLI